MKLTRANREMSAGFFYVGSSQPTPNYWTLIGLWKCDGRRGKATFFFPPQYTDENNTLCVFLCMNVLQYSVIGETNP